MRYLGLDLGTKTLGIAKTDSLGLIASPYKTIRFNNPEETIDELEKITHELDIKTVALGLPKNMNNTSGDASNRSLEYKKLLEKKLGLEVVLVDERLSTVEAEKYMINAGARREMRKQKIDAVAASIILDTYLKTREEKKE